METQGFQVITNQLREQKDQLTAEANTLRSKLSVLEDHIARIEAAAAMLSGTTLPSSAVAKAAKKERKKSLAPSPTTVQVIALMENAISECSSISESELKTLVEEQLSQSGYSRSGFALRWKEALSDERFRTAPDGVSLGRHTSPAPCNGIQAVAHKAPKVMNA